MKTMFQQFADARLTREQMKKVTGGVVVIYCGYTVYYSGMSITGFGKCGCSSVSDCDQIHTGKVGENHPNNIGIVSHGCWQGNKV